MNPLHFVVETFVNTFGITRPSPPDEESAGRYIVLMLLGVLLLLAAAAWVLHRVLAH